MLWKSKTSRRNLITLAIVIAAYAVMQSLSLAGALSRSLSGQLVPICVYIVMALSLNLVVGISGELSLGHAGFMSVGAFSGVIAAASLADKIGSPILLMLVSMLIGGVLAGIAGVLIGIPVLRLRGDYLAIVTLAFGEIIRNIMDCLYVTLDEAGLHFSMFSGSISDCRAAGCDNRAAPVLLPHRLWAGFVHADHHYEPRAQPRGPCHPRHP